MLSDPPAVIRRGPATRDDLIGLSKHYAGSSPVNPKVQIEDEPGQGYEIKVIVYS
jgi:hypothetical protein